MWIQNNKHSKVQNKVLRTLAHTCICLTVHICTCACMKIWREQGWMKGAWNISSGWVRAWRLLRCWLEAGTLLGCCLELSGLSWVTCQGTCEPRVPSQGDGQCKGAGRKGALGERVGMGEPKAKALQGKPCVSFRFSHWLVLRDMVQFTSQFSHGKIGTESTGKRGCEDQRHAVHLAWDMASVCCNMVAKTCALDKRSWAWVLPPCYTSTRNWLTCLHCFLVCGMKGTSSVFLWLCFRRWLKGALTGASCLVSTGKPLAIAKKWQWLVLFPSFQYCFRPFLALKDVFNK